MQLRDTRLNQLNKSTSSKINNLTPEYSRNYVLKEDKINFLVTWNGHLDKNILEKLYIRDFQMLNIICCDKNFNQNFTLQLEKFSNTQIIFEIRLGT